MQLTLTHGAESPGQSGLGNRVHTIGIYDRRLPQASLVCIDGDLNGGTPDVRRDLCDSDELTDVKNLVSSEYDDRPGLAPHLGQPDLAAPHGVPQASDDSQSSSTTSGMRS